MRVKRLGAIYASRSASGFASQRRHRPAHTRPDLGLRVQCFNLDSMLLTVHDGKGQTDPNIQHPTSNIEHLTSIACPKHADWVFDVGCWVLDVPVPPKATIGQKLKSERGLHKATQGHPKATLRPVDRHRIGTPKPPQGSTKAPPRLYQGSTKALPKPPQGSTKATPRR